MPNDSGVIATGQVVLPEPIRQLTELLAGQAHEQWARQRLALGWRRGPRRDDALMEDPCLAPYRELPDAEKEYARTAAQETLKTLVALGYRIEAPPAGAPAGADARLVNDQEALALLHAVADPVADLGLLLTLWRERDDRAGLRAPEVYRALAERLLTLGAPMMANEVATEGLERWPGDLRLRQLHGLALARSGAIERANQIFAELAQQGWADDETLGLLGRTHKDLGVLSVDPAERQRQLRMSYQAYARAYRSYNSRWTGINAATVALLLGEKDLAQTLARRIHTQSKQEWETHDPQAADRYWLLSTLGEAALILGEWTEAEDWYTRAAVAGRRRFGELNSSRRNARLLLQYLQRDPDRIDRILGIPRVVVFAGHMIDRPGRRQSRFPPQLEAVVAAEIRERLEKVDGRVGYASAACGSDLLFLEEILRRDGEAYVVLPYDQELFIRDSVDIIPGSRWAERFSTVLRRAAQVVTASKERMQGGSVSYDYANLVLHGLASVRAAELETDLVALAVWDGRRGDGPGGTATVCARWQQLGVKLERIHLTEILCRECPQLARADDLALELPEHPLETAPVDDTQVMAMLFADAVNYSKLTEEQVPRFVKHFLGAIADLVAGSPNAAVVRNTWGDGLYFVFEKVRDAGLFALDLCNLVTNTRWAEKGLPEKLNLRIALHAGPVYRCQDPITKQLNYTGTHVSRAARIEPITPPGQVYASQAFAALASVEQIKEFVCDYVKLAPFAKGYGTFPTYLVRRRRT